MSDGGEGMLPAFITALHGQLLQAKVHDPLMRPVTACYGIAPTEPPSLKLHKPAD